MIDMASPVPVTAVQPCEACRHPVHKSEAFLKGESVIYTVDVQGHLHCHVVRAFRGHTKRICLLNTALYMSGCLLLLRVLFTRTQVTMCQQAMSQSVLH